MIYSWYHKILLSYHINLVKLKMLWLSKILGMPYNLGWREYIKYQVQHKQGIYMAIVLKHKQIKEGERAVINSFGYPWL
jgi:hypothetical protein